MAHRRWTLTAVIVGILIVLAIFYAVLVRDGGDAGGDGSENQQPEPQSLTSPVAPAPRTTVI